MSQELLLSLLSYTSLENALTMTVIFITPAPQMYQILVGCSSFKNAKSCFVSLHFMYFFIVKVILFYSVVRQTVFFVSRMLLSKLVID